MTNEQLLDAYTRLARLRETLQVDQALLVELAAHARSAEGIVEAQGYGNGLLANCLFEISQSPPLFAAALCLWLTTEADVRLGKALVHQISVHEMDGTEPQSYDLSVFSEQQALLAGYRLCALVVSPSVSLGWALSLARDFHQSDLVMRSLELLLSYHRTELPVSTRRLLSAEASLFTDLPTSTVLLTALELEEVELDRLPQLRELEMDAQMRSLFSSLKRSEQREIHRRSNEMSVFAQFVTQRHLKYATRTAFETVVDNGLQDSTVAMSSFSLLVEVPLMDTCDPMLGEMQRKRLWRGVSQ